MPAASIHPVYGALLKEMPLSMAAWSEDSRLFTAGQMADEVALGSAVALRHAQAVLGQALAFACEKCPDVLRPDWVSQVAVTPREPLVAAFRAMPGDLAVYVTMSRTFGAAEMARLLEEGDPDAKSFATDLLRISRDIVGRQAAALAESAPRSAVEGD